MPISQLLENSLPAPAAQALLTSFGVADWQAAARHLQQIAALPGARDPLLSLLPHLLAALTDSADPDQGLIQFERFITSAENAPALLVKLAENPRAIEILLTVFSGSQFLTEILLRNPLHLDVLTRREQLARRKTVDDYLQAALRALPASASPLDEWNALRRYQRGEILRLGAADLLALLDLPALTAQLSALAEGLTRACLARASQHTGIPAENFVVLAMGKMGGRELNYSSDIDLLFLSRGETNFIPLAQKLIEALSSVTAEGFLYRVDMRLRPWGRDGALVTSLEGYLGYLQRHARQWEKQALLKARPVAGNLALGEEFRQQAEPFIFGENPETLRAAVHAMKQRTEDVLRAKGRDWGEVKLGEGSIRDVEFVTQYLQLAHGGANPKLRKRATLNALPRLARFGLLTPGEAQTLADGYIFQRTVEHFLQMMHYRQTYTLPADPTALTHLARRLGFRGEQARDYFLERYKQHSAAIRAIYQKYIGGIEIESPPAPESASPGEAAREHLARMDASYAAAFLADEINLHAALAAQLGPHRLAQVQATPLLEGRWKITVVAYDYLGELSLICGLMFVYGWDIETAQIFTYETGAPAPAESAPVASPPRRRPRPLSASTSPAPDSPASTRRKIVDVFTIRPIHGLSPEHVQAYTDDLRGLLALMHKGGRREARSVLAQRVGELFAGLAAGEPTLYPLEITIDNDLSARYTALRIETTDATGFLYEFTNALSLTHTYIARMVVQTSGRKVQDLLFVTDERGNKITDPAKQRELRAAAVLIKHFTHLLPRSPNPAGALLRFREFLAELFARPAWLDDLASIERPEVLQNLAHLLGVSDFLWDDFMRMQYANLFPVVRDVDALATAKSRADLQHALGASLAEVHAGPQAPREDAPWRKALNDFKDREMFRIDMRHLLGHTREFWDFSLELTDLTEVIVNAAYHLTSEDLRSIHGAPRRADGSLSQMAVVALGKCGGRELGFASDVELMFVYDGEGQTDGPQPISASAFHEKVVQHVQSAIKARQEGIFHVDLQLRPYGKAGSLAVSLDSFQHYYAPDGPAWAYERQALVKLRPIAGDEPLGARLCALRDAFTYNGASFDVTAMRAMRERQSRHLVKAGSFNAKYSSGGLVDVEYLIQALQINHGAHDAHLRQTNIRAAMDALHAAGILSDEDYTALHKAHTFLRWLIDAMRVVRGNAKDITVPPFGSDEFAFLARRLRYGSDVERLRADLASYQSAVREMNARLLG